MPDFTLFIPLEIFSDILSHVNQVDCTECMTVCRRWYKLIPQHGKDLWEELEISGTSWPTFNNAVLECLGTHVKKVSIISFRNPNKALRRLGGQGCNIQSLEIKRIVNINEFDLYYTQLFTGVRLIGRTLKELYIDGSCSEYGSLSLLLHLLPALTHLTIKLKYKPYYLVPPYGERMNEEILCDIQSSNDDYNLVFFSLNIDFPCWSSTEEIIRRSPRLKYLMVSSYTLYRKSPEVPSTILAHIVKLCPSIRYIHWGYHVISDGTEKDWLKLSRRKSRDTDHEDNNDYGKGEVNHLRQVEFCGYDERQCISVLTTILQQPSIVEHLHLSGSHSVDLYKTLSCFTRHAFNSLSQPTQLKSLELVDFCVPNEPENYIFFQDFFNYFQRIERLKMYVFVPLFHNLEEQPRCMYKMVEAIGHQLHQLRHLYLGFTGHDRSDTEISLCDNCFTTLYEANQKLEILHLRSVPISDDMLLGLCHHPELHTLNLVGYRLHNLLTKHGLVLFARKLKEQEQNGCGKIQSMLLSCDYCDDVTDEVLEELAGVESLKNLRIESNSTITDSGINKFASIKRSSNNSHNKVELYDCNNVSLGNPHVVFVLSPF